jgi:hypothetical protein
MHTEVQRLLQCCVVVAVAWLTVKDECSNAKNAAQFVCLAFWGCGQV